MSRYFKLTLPKPYLYFSFLSLCALASCSKDGGQITQPVVDECSNISEVHSYRPYSTQDYGLLVEFTYDELGRVRTMSDGNLYNVSFEYFSDKIVQDTDIPGNDNIHEYTLNEKGLVTRDSYFDYQYTYNTEGYLVSFHKPYGSGSSITGVKYDLKYSNGNLVEITSNDDLMGSSKISLDYYDEPNQDLMGFSEPLYIADVLVAREKFVLIKGGFFGKQSAQLLKSIDYNRGYGPFLKSYEKDDKGRIIEAADGYRFVYECP